jgi:hypothetical protein
MSYGIFIYDEGDGWRRPKSKAEIKRTLPERITLESTSDFVGYVRNMPVGRYDFVGPDPYNDRQFYGNIVVAENGQIFIS